MIQKSPQPSVTGKQLMKRRLKWVGIISLVPLVIVLVSLCYFGYQESIAWGELKQKIAELRQAGEPLDDESMARHFEATTHKEGTKAWTEIVGICQAANNTASDLPIVGNGKLPLLLTPGSEWADEPRVSEYLVEIKPLLKRIQQTESFPKPVWMPIQFDGFQTLLPAIQESRNVARILDLDATHALYHKDSERALKDIIAIQTVSESFNWRFFLVTKLVSVAITGVQRDAIQRSLTMNVWSDEQLKTLSDQLKQKYEVTEEWSSTIAGERAMAYIALNDHVTLKRYVNSTTIPTPVALLPIVPSTRLEILQAYGDWQHLADAGEMGLSERAASSEKHQFAKQISLTNVYLGLFMPAISAYAGAFDRLETSRRLTLTSIAIKRYQLKNQRWPKSLSELTEVGLRLDDWTTTDKQNFGYEVDDDFAYVWSTDSKSKQVPKLRPAPIDPDQLGGSLVWIR